MPERLLCELLNLLFFDVPLSERVRELLTFGIPEGEKTATPSQIVGAVRALAHRHDLAHLLTVAFEKARIEIPAEHAGILAKEQAIAVLRFERLSMACDNLFGLLEKNEIDFLPMKGSFSRSLYPEGWMRTSADIDVLVPTEQVPTAEKLLKENGFTPTSECDHHHNFESPEGCTIELHFAAEIAGGIRQSGDALAELWDHATLSDGKKHQFVLSAEMFTLHHISHMAKHIVHGGCGVRPFLDLAIIRTKLPMTDPDVFDRLCDKGSLTEFARYAFALTDFWFGTKSFNEPDDLSPDAFSEFRQFVLFGGVYGNMENSTASRIDEGRFKYYVKRLFPPYSQLLFNFKFLKKAPFLLPLAWFLRFFHLFRKGRMKTAAQESKEIRTHDADDSRRVTEMFGTLGISDD